jgi:hypothetical protein
VLQVVVGLCWSSLLLIFDCMFQLPFSLWPSSFIPCHCYNYHGSFMCTN